MSATADPDAWPGPTEFRCLCCDKTVACDEHGLPDGGGRLTVSFGYGSVHDQGPAGLYPRDPDTPRLHRLLAASRVVGVLCDACFEARQDRLVGYRVRPVRERWALVVPPPSA